MTKKFREMCKIYEIFASDWDCDFSDEAMQEMYEFESFGRGTLSISGFNTSEKRPNGFAVGKKWLNVQVTAWLVEKNQDSNFWRIIQPELYADKRYPHWWLNRIFR